MREIKYRGKRIADGEWIYGSFTHVHSVEGYPSIIEFGDNRFVSIYPLTRSECTGLKDKNGTEVYEGDILKSGLGEVFFDEKICAFMVRWHNKEWAKIRQDRHWGNKELLFHNAHIAWEVIGNVYENPELLNNG